MSQVLLPQETRVGEVALTVKSLEGALAFYEGVLGLRVLEGGAGTAVLGSERNAFLRLVEDPAAESPGGRARLYHFAILFPSRQALAVALRRLLDARWLLGGAADHLVSEALYLTDPEGNGIELYRDRAPEDWQRVGGRIRMDSLPLDIEGLLRELPVPAAARDSVPSETRVGHVHLQVRDLGEAEQFYREVVGLELKERFGSSASFLAAGNYHHHLGINTWGTAGAARALEGAQGLRWYRLSLPERRSLEALAGRLEAGNVGFEWEGEGLSFRDPSGHRLKVDVA